MSTPEVFENMHDTHSVCSLSERIYYGPYFCQYRASLDDFNSSDYAAGMDDIGKLLQIERKQRGISQKELARRLGWVDDSGEPKQARVSHYESGRRPLMVTDAIAIAEAIGTTLADVLQGDKNTESSQTKLSVKELGVIAAIEEFDFEDFEDLFHEIEGINKRRERRLRRSSSGPRISKAKEVGGSRSKAGEKT